MVFAVVVVCSWFAWPTSVDACKYCVRDVAFVELAPDPWHFRYGGKNEQWVRVARDAAAAFLGDANVEVRGDGDFAGSDALRLLLERDDVRVELTPPSLDEDAVWDAVEAVSSSVARRSAAANLFDAHSVIFVFEGDDPTENERAAAAVKAACATVEGSLAKLPKPIARGPHVETVTFADRAREAVLWASVGSSTSASDAVVAITMGRFRLLGEPIIFPGGTRGDLESRLAMVGLDCECGLDRRWMQGRMLPHDWTTDDEQRATDALGFDPGNPLVRSEIQRILSRGGDGERVGAATASAPHGYSEVAVDTPNPRPTPEPSASTDPPPRSTKPTADDASSVAFGLSTALTLLVLVVVGGGVLLMVRGGRLP